MTAVVKPINVFIPSGGFSNAAPASTLDISMAEFDSDESLMLRFQNGDNPAFDRLFERHKNGIFRYVERQCGHDAEEIFQDVWFKLIQARHQFRVDSATRFKTYLYRIAHNRLMDYFRHNSVKNKIIQNVEIDDLEHTVPVDSPSPEMHIDTQRKIEKLLSLIQGLSHEQREAFLLRQESGLSIQDIAKVTGVNPETAKSRLRYAIERIRHGMRGLE